jgi:hypothetical protein
MRSKIYADFNNLDDENRIRLTTQGTQSDLKRLGIQLTEGMALTFYMDDADDDGRPDDIIVDGVAHYCNGEKYWVAVVDWASVYHASVVTKSAHTNGGPSTQSTKKA